MDGNQGVGAGMALGLARAGMAGRSACGMGPQVAVRCCGAPGGREDDAKLRCPNSASGARVHSSLFWLARRRSKRKLLSTE